MTRHHETALSTGGLMVANTIDVVPKTCRSVFEFVTEKDGTQHIHHIPLQIMRGAKQKENKRNMANPFIIICE